jgi:AcrR family transcriptional regulator
MESIAELKKGNAASTRAKILTAAQLAFSRHGYSEAGIRDIGEMIGLSSTILLRYYGTKAGLFEAALREALRAEAGFPPRAEFGRTTAARLADPNLDMRPHAMIVLATGHEEAREIAARVLHEETLAPIANWLGPPDADARSRQILALWSGFVLYTFQLTVSSGRDKIDPTMVEWLAQSLQAIVDQCEPGSAAS